MPAYRNRNQRIEKWIAQTIAPNKEKNAQRFDPKMSPIRAPNLTFSSAMKSGDVTTLLKRTVVGKLLRNCATTNETAPINSADSTTLCSAILNSRASSSVHPWSCNELTKMNIENKNGGTFHGSRSATLRTVGNRKFDWGVWAGAFGALLAESIGALEPGNSLCTLNRCESFSRS